VSGEDLPRAARAAKDTLGWTDCRDLMAMIDGHMQMADVVIALAVEVARLSDRLSPPESAAVASAPARPFGAIAVDPTNCGCTGCLTGVYIPLDAATREQKWAAHFGLIADNTSGQLAEWIETQR
jgi:hypothetical protein